MKKLKNILLAALIVICLCSCEANNHICVNGIEQFRKNEGNYELNSYILPSDDFLDRFEYIQANYHFSEQYESWASLFGIERSLIATTYEQDIYAQAKEFCLQEMQLSNQVVINYNGYTFIENTKLAIEQERYDTCLCPGDFNMLVYNDVKQCLVFIGYYNPHYNSEKTCEIMDNWGVFLEEIFSDLYNFDL